MVPAPSAVPGCLGTGGGGSGRSSSLAGFVNSGKKREDPEHSAESKTVENASPGQGDSQESSPQKVARKGAELLGIELSRQELETWGNRIHWVYGTQWGVLYSLLFPRPGPFSGLLYGAGLWLGSDGLLLWVLGIAKAPSAYPLRVHLEALVAHCIYGVYLGVLVRGMRD